MSNEVYEAWEMLEAAGLIEEEEVWSVTDSGVDLAQSLYEEVLCDEHNAPAKRVIDEVSARWRTAWSAQPLMKHTYGLPAYVDGTGPTIEEMPLREEFDPPLSPEEAGSCLAVGNDWVETIALKLNPSTLPLLQAATKDFHAGRFFVT